MAINPANEIVGSTLPEQLKVVESNLKTGLRTVGAGIKDITEMSTYIARLNQERDTPSYASFREKFGSPPGVLLGVSELAGKELLVETDMKVAVSKSYVRKLVCGSG